MLDIWTADTASDQLAGQAPRGLAPGNCITALKPGVKDPNRVNVFLDGKFRFSLTLAQLSDAKLKIGQTLTTAEIEDLQAAAEFGKLYQRTLEYCLTRPHSEKEIRDYLKRKKAKRELDQKRYDDFRKRLESDPEYQEYVKTLRADVRAKNERLKDFTEDNRYEYRGRAKTGLPTKPAAPISTSDIDRVVEKLKSSKVLDDAEFARYFVENRNRIKGSSLKKLKLELRAKGVSDQLIDAVLSSDEYGESPRDEKAELLKVLEKKRRHAKPATTPDEQKAADQKLIQYLLRQGFPYDLIQDVLRETDSQN